MERPLFWVVLLQSASSLAQQRCVASTLLWGFPSMIASRSRSAVRERSYLIREFLNGRTESSSADITNCVIR